MASRGSGETLSTKNQKILNLESAVGAHVSRITELEGNLHDAEALFNQQLKAQQIDLNREREEALKGKEEEVLQWKNKYAKSDDMVNNITADYDFLREQTDEVHKEKADDLAKIQAKVTEIESLKAELVGAEEHITDIEGKLFKSEEKEEAAVRELQELKSIVDTRNLDIVSLKAERTNAQKQLYDNTTDVSSLRQEKADRDNVITTLQNTIGEQIDIIRGLENQIGAFEIMEQDKIALEDQLEKFRADVDADFDYSVNAYVAPSGTLMLKKDTLADEFDVGQMKGSGSGESGSSHKLSSSDHSDEENVLSDDGRTELGVGFEDEVDLPGDMEKLEQLLQQAADDESAEVEEPAVFEPVVEESATEKPTIAEPTAPEQPAIEKPAAPEEPAVAQPSAPESMVFKDRIIINNVAQPGHTLSHNPLVCWFSVEKAFLLSIAYFLFVYRSGIITRHCGYDAASSAEQFPSDNVPGITSYSMLVVSDPVRNEQAASRRAQESARTNAAPSLAVDTNIHTDGDPKLTTFPIYNDNIHTRATNLPPMPPNNDPPPNSNPSAPPPRYPFLTTFPYRDAPTRSALIALLPTLLIHILLYYLIYSTYREQQLWFGANNITRMRVWNTGRSGGGGGASMWQGLFGENVSRRLDRATERILKRVMGLERRAFVMAG